MSRGYGLTDSEKKEVNKNTRAAQQSLMYKRRNIKSVAKNNLAGLGGAALGAGLGYGALKGAVGMAGARSAIKGAKLSRKLNKQKVFNSMSEYKDMVALADAYKTKAKLKKDTAQLVAKMSNSPTVAGALGGMTGGIAGNMLRDRSEVKKFMKERYGDNYKPTIKQNEVDRVLAQREKSACDIVEESFDKVAFNLGAVAKTVGNGIKSMATATKNLPNSIGNVKKLHNFATNTNLSQSTRNVAATARNKQIGNVAKGMALPAMGVAGAGMIGAGVNNALHNNNEKTAFDIVNDSFDKVARRYC